VSGYVTDLRVRSNQFVKKGDILFVVDQERYRLALANAEATVAARLAQYQMLQQQFERRSKLTLNLSITQEDLDNVHRQTDSARASHQQSLADRDLAALNLVWTALHWQGFFERLCNAGWCGHVSDLFVRHIEPLAIMPSAYQVPTRSAHSRCWVDMGSPDPAVSTGLLH
jgi:Biotin-lipoyl like